MRIDLSWTEFKAQVLTPGLPYRYIDRGKWYDLYASDAPFQYACIISKDDTSDQTDFEANYKTASFSAIAQFDTDGAAIVRPKAAKRGWSFWAAPIELTTSTIGGNVYFKSANGIDIPGITCKIYDINNAEIIEPGDANINLDTCVKTVLDFEPAFDYEMIGGALRINSNPAQDVRLWIVGAPDIPAQYGGSKEFASGINLKFMAPDDSFEIDGRVSKYVTYSAVTHSGKLRIILKHPAGLNLNVQVVIHMYRL